MTSSNNRRIAKNTIVLYLRMALTMFVSLFTSRIVLKRLGVEDFGINNVVAGVVGMFSFLNASMSGATSRFLSFCLGKNDETLLKIHLGAAKSIHWMIALLVLFLAEILGLYFLNTKLVIPESRMFAANWVFQCCVLSTMFTITQVPYTACILSHEKMLVYAYIEILNTFLKLISVFLLCLDFDKLVLWGTFSATVSVIVSLVYRIYCWTYYKESRTKFVFRKNILKPMLSFSGWDLYGNLSVMARTQGVNMLLNMFFGPLMNAAAAVATQVQSAVMSLSGNLVTAMRPQIVKRYAAGEIQSMLTLLEEVGKLAFLLISFLTIPLLIERNYVLHLWLGDVPELASYICIYVLLINVFANQSVILVSVIHATGKIFRLSFINGSLYLLVIPVSYISFKVGGAYWTSFLSNVLAVFLGMLSNAWTIHLYIPQFSFSHYLIKSLFPCVSIFMIILLMCLGVSCIMEQGFLRLVLVTLLSSFLLCLFGFFFLISRNMRGEILKRVKKKICLNR